MPTILDVAVLVATVPGNDVTVITVPHCSYAVPAYVRTEVDVRCRYVFEVPIVAVTVEVSIVSDVVTASITSPAYYLIVVELSENATAIGEAETSNQEIIAVAITDESSSVEGILGCVTSKAGSGTGAGNTTTNSKVAKLANRYTRVSVVSVAGTGIARSRTEGSVETGETFGRILAGLAGET